MKKLVIHKNESPVSAGQIVKPISKSATEILTGLVRFGLLSDAVVPLVLAIAIQLVLMAFAGVLQ